MPICFDVVTRLVSDIPVKKTVAVSTAVLSATFGAVLFGGQSLSAPTVLVGLPRQVLQGTLFALLLMGAALSHIGYQIRNAAAQIIGMLLAFAGFFMLVNVAIGVGFVDRETVVTSAGLSVAYFVALVTYAYQRKPSRFSNWEAHAIVAIVATPVLWLLSEYIVFLETLAFIVATLGIMAHIFFVTGQTKRMRQGTVANTARLYTALITLPVDVLVYILLMVRRVR